MAVPWQDFAGKWQVEDSENMEDFLGEVGVPYLVRKIAAKASSYLMFKVNGDKVAIQMTSTFHTQPENEFHINGGETVADFGKKWKAKARWEDNKMIVELNPSEDSSLKPQKVTRQIIDGKIHQTMEIGKVVAKQRLTKVTA